MYRTRDAAVVPYVQDAVDGTAERQQPTCAIGRYAAGDDQPRATTSPFAKIGPQFWIVVEPVFQTGVHRTHDDAVTQGSETEIQWREQVRVFLISHLYPEL
jgi:hypothetical protein